MLRKALIFLTALVLFQPSLLQAKQDSSAQTFEEKLAGQFRIDEITYSPDGRRAAFAAREPGNKLPLRSAIWLFESGALKATRSTPEGASESMLRWSPDGSKLAFLAKHAGGKTQIRFMNASVGKSVPLADGMKDVEDIAWLGDGSGVVVLAASDDGDGDAQQDLVIGSRHHKPKELRLVDLKTRSVKKITRSPWAIGQFATIPGSKDIVVTADDEFKPEAVIRRLFVIDGGTGKMREFGQIDGVEYAKMKISPDGRNLAYIGSAHGPTTFDIHVQSIAGGAAKDITGLEAAAIDRMVSDYEWVGDSELVANVQDGLGSSVYHLNLDGTKALLKAFDKVSLSALSAARNGNMIYALTSDTEPTEIWVREGGADRKISELHREFPPLVEGRPIDYPSWDGTRIEALLFQPSTQHVSKLPTVVLIHGGPTGRWSHKVNNWAQVLVANGFAVFAPNIRGSAGYSQAFLKSNRADWGGGDFKDIMAGVDWLIEQGIADPQRLGIAGWSYGGFMSARAVTQTSRFKASVAGAGMLDLNVQWGAGLADVVPYDSWYNGQPWNDREKFTLMSPITHIKAVKTPTLLLVGEADDVDPTVQNWQFYRALRMNGVPAELIVYPREGHEFSERKHVADAMRRMTQWMKSHLQGFPTKEVSP